MLPTNWSAQAYRRYHRALAYFRIETTSPATWREWFLWSRRHRVIFVLDYAHALIGHRPASMCEWLGDHSWWDVR